MKDGRMATEERDLIDQAQDHVAGLKDCLRGIQRINTDAGRLAAANAAMGALGALIVWHSDATAKLREHWPEDADDIQTRGGGGGRG